MTYPRFLKIARQTASTFWPLVYECVTQEEATYLRQSPAARRNLDRRLFLALAHTLLTDDQISKASDLGLEDPQTNIPTGPHTATPFSKAIPPPKPHPCQEPFS